MTIENEQLLSLAEKEELRRQRVCGQGKTFDPFIAFENAQKIRHFVDDDPDCDADHRLGLVEFTDLTMKDSIAVQKIEDPLDKAVFMVYSMLKGAYSKNGKVLTLDMVASFSMQEITRLNLKLNEYLQAGLPRVK
jgi:hypothetical protein